MNFLNLLRSVEQLIFEISLWFIMVPKTIYRVLSRPKNIPAYIQSELAKENNKQFEDEMSPPLLWLLLVIVPIYMFVKELKVLPLFGTVIKPENYFIYLVLAFISFLMIPALIIILFDGKKISRSSFKEYFYIQCYIQAPVLFFTILLSGLLKSLHYDFDAIDQEGYAFINGTNGWKDIVLLVIGGLLFFLAYLEYKILRSSGKSILKSLFIISISVIAAFAAMFITAGFGYLLFF